ncbi:MAG: hypothetical protein H8E32_01340 [Nitrospinae bacterium]|nr:hypothetical protein [Nitrospinota bacterium]
MRINSKDETLKKNYIQTQDGVVQLFWPCKALKLLKNYHLSGSPHSLWSFAMTC